jgi:hypothetical protein
MPPGIRAPWLQWSVYGHLWLALCIAAQAAWTARFVRGAEGVVRLAAAVALGTFAAYGAMRLLRARDLTVQGSAHLQWTMARRRLLLPAVVLAALAAWWCLLPFPHDMAFWCAVIAAAAGLYVLPLRTGGGAVAGLRRVPLLKSPLIALTAALTVVALPMQLGTDAPSVLDVWFNTCMRMPLLLAVAITFDLRDLPVDPPGLHTLPQVFGARGARMLAIVLVLLAALFDHVFLRNLGYATAARTVLAGHAVSLVLIALATPRRSPLYFGLALDGALLLVPLCGWLGTFR